MEQEGYSVTYIEEITEDSYGRLISNAYALIIRIQPLSKETLDNASKLKVVSRHGVGYDAIDLNALNSRKIALTIVGDVSLVSVAEHAMMMLLACARHAIRGDQSVRDPSKWNWRNQLEQREISGSNLLIVGFGRAGQKLAQMAKAFKMGVRAFDPFISPEQWPDKDVIRISDLAQGLAWADCLSLRVPKSETPLINVAEFTQMKPGMIIANTSRGGVICEKSLVNALKSGKVHAAGLDVFEEEPHPSAKNLVIAMMSCFLHILLGLQIKPVSAWRWHVFKMQLWELGLSHSHLGRECVSNTLLSRSKNHQKLIDGFKFKIRILKFIFLNSLS